MLIMIIYILKSCFTVVTSNNHADTYTTFGHDFFVASRAILEDELEGSRTVLDQFTHILRMIYALPALARRVCAIRTLSCRLGHAIITNSLLFWILAVEETIC